MCLDMGSYWPVENVILTVEAKSKEHFRKPAWDDQLLSHRGTGARRGKHSCGHTGARGTLTITEAECPIFAKAETIGRRKFLLFHSQIWTKRNTTLLLRSQNSLFPQTSLPWETITALEKDFK